MLCQIYLLLSPNYVLRHSIDCTSIYKNAIDFIMKSRWSHNSIILDVKQNACPCEVVKDTTIYSLHWIVSLNSIVLSAGNADTCQTNDGKLYGRVVLRHHRLHVPKIPLRWVVKSHDKQNIEPVSGYKINLTKFLQIKYEHLGAME